MKKFELTNNTKVVDGTLMYQIRALRDFSDVKKGDLGGWVEQEENLSQRGNCWIYDDAKALTQTNIRDNARVYNNVFICGFVDIIDNAVISDNVKIGGKIIINSDIHISGNAVIFNQSDLKKYTK